jgi:Flp pilus assembly protein TadD
MMAPDRLWAKWFGLEHSRQKFATRRDGWLILFVFVAVGLAYQPVWQAGFIWDDNVHVTPPALRSWAGLGRIWFDQAATQQYYPVLFSTFWIEHHLWGNFAPGYHCVNLVLHALNAVMVGLILRRLRLPGAELAAGIFALHPVMVESVAWITELKNTLSGFFYLSAALAYLRFDETRGRRSYGLALVLFVLALLSKTVTATLPGALLVVCWWQRGRLRWRQDVRPVLPFFFLGAAGGLFVAWLEKKVFGADGSDFAFSIAERGLIAGRALGFYAGKLLWPANLVFIYPRWTISLAAWWQYLFPAGTLLGLFLLWRRRSRSRGPLAAALFFAGTLFPMLGFLNIYSFLFSFVADHFQYLASLGVIAAAAAGLTGLARQWKWSGAAAAGPAWALLAVLGVLTWRQSRIYHDEETLYRAILDRNRDCWMAHDNLGNVLDRTGRVNEAITHYEAALRIRPHDEKAHNNLGNAFTQTGRMQEAVEHYQATLRIQPDNAGACYNLGNCFSSMKRLTEAIDYYRRALRLQPDYPEAANNLGIALVQTERLEEAKLRFEQAMRLDPDYGPARQNLAQLQAMLQTSLPGNSLSKAAPSARSP